LFERFICCCSLVWALVLTLRHALLSVVGGTLRCCGVEHALPFVVGGLCRGRRGWCGRWLEHAWYRRCWFAGPARCLPCLPLRWQATVRFQVLFVGLSVWTLTVRFEFGAASPCFAVRGELHYDLVLLAEQVLFFVHYRRCSCYAGAVALYLVAVLLPFLIIAVQMGVNRYEQVLEVYCR